MLERAIEKRLFACRWLLAPMYLGLSLALVALAIKFFQEVAYSLSSILQLAETDLVLIVLSLIDIVLVGSLIVMVMLSGYENFVSRIDTGTAGDSRVTSDIRRLGGVARRARPPRLRLPS